MDLIILGGTILGAVLGKLCGETEAGILLGFAFSLLFVGFLVYLETGISRRSKL